ncbi:MAG: hypothetical protein FJ134_00515 [Deltaproteobacteria bacterium]|nr:hypothetical protein [Deltaproteobacteria bacterium]
MRLRTIFLAVLALTLVASAAWAVTATQDITISTNIASRAKITMPTTTVTFPDSDPDTTPSVSATQNPLTITCAARTGASSAVTVTVKAADDLKDGAKSIGISNVAWTATGAGYIAGTMSKSADQNVGSWTGSGSRAGTLSFALANSWDYETGNYSATATYTLTVP